MYGDYVSKNLGIVNANINQETTGGALIGGWKGDLEYTGDYGLYAVPQNTYEVNDSVSWQQGNHTLKFGGTFIRRQVEFFNPQEGKGYFWIDEGTVDFTGYEVSELLAGGMDQYEIGSQSGYFANIGQEDGIFVQDDWRVNRRLTGQPGPALGLPVPSLRSAQPAVCLQREHRHGDGGREERHLAQHHRPGLSRLRPSPRLHL